MATKSAGPLESTISKNIVTALRKRGAWCFKVHGGPMQMAGIPDIVGCYHGLFIAVETKRPGNKPSAIQEVVISQLRKAGACVCVAYCVEDAMALLDAIENGPRSNQ